MKPTILCAEDDPDDQFIISEAFKRTEIDTSLQFVVNGEQLLDYLYRRNGFEDPAQSPRPDLIFVDLRMPRNGHNAIKEIKSDPELGRIPIVVLTTSDHPDDVIRSFDMGVRAYIAKSEIFKYIPIVAAAIRKPWAAILELPSSHRP